MRSRITFCGAFYGIVCLVLVSSGAALAAPKPIEVPDLTTRPEIDTKKTYNLGATGLRGWIFTKPPTHLDALQGRTTMLARQILVTHVGEKSPADGLVKVGDVILGVDSKPFEDDARKLLAAAIQRAESAAGKGDLNLLVWRNGTTTDIHLTLRLLGEYDAANPLESEKAKLILEEACQALAKEKLADDWAGPISGLAMLASGKEEFLPVVTEYARRIAEKTTAQDPAKPERGTWHLSYRALFLCEYFLLTHDEAVLPAIEHLSSAMARGQGMFGTFGHNLLPPGPNGELHRPIPSYGPVNQTGLVTNIAILYGNLCGVKDTEVPAAVDRGSKFFATFVGRGSIPYGEHEPYITHDNNGKCAMSAVFYSLQKDRVTEARYFAKMTVASFKNREAGHTGQGQSYLWTAIGANCAGPEALGAYFNETSWHYDLVRRCDGSFTYDGGEQYGAGTTHDNTYYGKSSYNGLSPNACYILTYALPLKKLLLTGRDANKAVWLDEKEAKEAIASGHFDVTRKTAAADELVTALGDWSPIARSWAAQEQATRPEAKSLVPKLIEMADGPHPLARQGACEALGLIKDPAALPVLVKHLDADDHWLRFKATRAIGAMGDASRPVLPEMLQAVIDQAWDRTSLNWNDPVMIAQSELGAIVFDGMLRRSMDEVDEDLLLAAIRAMLTNTDGRGRGRLGHLLKNQLTVDQVRALGPDLRRAVEEIAPADRMFGDNVRTAAVDALAKYHFEEGIDIALLYAQTMANHSSERRMGDLMKVIASYGTAAKRIVPDLRKLVDQIHADPDFPDWAKKIKAQHVLDGIAAIEAATEQPELIRFATK
jgi:HEAT repeat protein